MTVMHTFTGENTYLDPLNSDHRRDRKMRRHQVLLEHGIAFRELG